MPNRLLVQRASSWNSQRWRGEHQRLPLSKWGSRRALVVGQSSLVTDQRFVHDERGQDLSHGQLSTWTFHRRARVVAQRRESRNNARFVR